MSSDRSTSPQSNSGSSASGGGGGAPVTMGEKKAQVESIPIEQREQLMKKALTSLAKSKKELEIKLDASLKDNKMLQERFDSLKDNYDATVRELDDLKAQQVKDRAGGGAGGVTATVGAAGAALKNLIGRGSTAATASPAAAGGDGAGLSKADAIAVMEDNEKLHIQMFEMRASMDTKTGRLQTEVDALKTTLTQVTSNEKKLEEIRADLDAKLGKASKDNETLRKRVATSAEAVKYFESKFLQPRNATDNSSAAVGNDSMIQEEYLTLIGKSNTEQFVEEKKERAGGRHEAAGSLDSIDHRTLVSRKPEQVQEVVSQIRGALEGFLFALTALVPACSEAIHTLFRGSRDSQERARQLSSFLVELKEHNQDILAAVSAVANWNLKGGAAVVSAGGEDETEMQQRFRDLTVVLLQTTQDWCAFLSDHALLLLRAVYLSAAIPVDDAKRDAEALTPTVCTALLRVLIACRNEEENLHLRIPSPGGDSGSSSSKIGGNVVTCSSSEDNMTDTVEGLRQLGEVLTELGQGAPNDKVRMALQHMKIKCLQVADVLVNVAGPSPRRDCHVVSTSPQKDNEASSSASKSTKNNSKSVGGGSDVNNMTATGEQCNAVNCANRKKLEQLEDQTENMRLLLFASDQRIATFQQQYHCCVAELDERQTLADRLATECESLRENASDYDSERQSIIESFEEQIKVLSDQLTVPHNNSMISGPPSTSGGGNGGGSFGSTSH